MSNSLDDCLLLMAYGYRQKLAHAWQLLYNWMVYTPSTLIRFDNHSIQQYLRKHLEALCKCCVRLPHGFPMASCFCSTGTTALGSEVTWTLLACAFPWSTCTFQTVSNSFKPSAKYAKSKSAGNLAFLLWAILTTMDWEGQGWCFESCIYKYIYI